MKMLTIHRYFNIDKARRDLGYEPLISFDKGWAQVLSLPARPRPAAAVATRTVPCRGVGGPRRPAMRMKARGRRAL